MRRPSLPVRFLASLLSSSLAVSSVSANAGRSRSHESAQGTAGHAVRSLQESDLDLLLHSVSLGEDGPRWLEGKLDSMGLPAESISLASGLSAQLSERARTDAGFAKALS